MTVLTTRSVSLLGTPYYKLRPPFYSCSKIPRKSALSLQHASSRLFFRPKGIRHLEILPSSKTSSVLDSEDVQVGEASVVKALIKHWRVQLRKWENTRKLEIFANSGVHRKFHQLNTAISPFDLYYWPWENCLTFTSQTDSSDLIYLDLNFDI